MLVITRKNGQKIMINDNIEITVVEAKNGSAKIAIQADKQYKIYREEIYLQIKLANLVGKTTDTSAVDSVSNLLKGGTTLNDENIESQKTDEFIVDEKQSKSIKINRKNDEAQQ